MTRVIRLIALLLMWVLATFSAAAAEQRIATHGNLTASVADNSSCGASARLTVRAPDQAAFSGDRIELQRLLGVARGALEADCPTLRQIDVSGLANGRQAFQGTLTAANGWRLAVAGPRSPPDVRQSPSANAVPCEHDPTNPLIGCWLRVIPAEPGPAIAIFTSAGRLLGGTPAEITSPQVWGANWWRSRMYGFGHIIEYTSDQGWRGQFNPPVFHEQCSVMELQGRGAFSFLAQDNPNDYRLYVRLNVRHITRDVLSDEAEIERIGQLLSQDIDSDECRDPYQSTFESDSVFRALLAVTPALGLAGRTRLLQPRLSRGFSQRHGIANKPSVNSHGRPNTNASGRPAGEIGRSSLRESYTREVAGLRDRASTMRRQGFSSEEIARTLSTERRRIGEAYKDMTSPNELARIHQRNQDRYGDPLGPTVEWLRSRGRTWDQIIESSSRTGGRDLGY